MRKIKIPWPAALGTVAAFTVGRYLLSRFGYVPGPVIVLLISPLVEEGLYRGILFDSLREKLGFGWSAAISAGLFALGHQGATAMGIAFLFGLGAAWLKEKTGKLRWSMLAHVGWNLAVFLIGSR